MSEIEKIYMYINSRFNNCVSSRCTDNEIIIKFYDGFEMKITFKNRYMIYFNNYFYYDIDGQDIVDTIEEIFSNKYVYCLGKDKIKIFYQNEKINQIMYTMIWTINKKLK